MQQNYRLILLFIISLALATSAAGPFAPVGQADYQVSLSVTETAQAGKDVIFYVTVKENGNLARGVNVTFLVGGIDVGSCTTDNSGSCKGGYNFDTAGYYQVTALAGTGSSVKYITILPPPTPTETITPDPNATLTFPTLGGPTLPAGLLRTPTLILPTLNIPSSTPTVEPTFRAAATRTPVIIAATETPTPSGDVALPTYDPGYTPTPFVPKDTTRPIVNGLSALAILLTIAGAVIIVIRVRKYQQLTKMRNKR